MQVTKNKIAITYELEAEQDKALQLAQKLHLPVITTQIQKYDFLLVVTPEHLELRDLRVEHTKPLFIDFLAGKSRHRLQNLGKKNELIAKAVGMKSGYCPSVLDATAGMGQDAFVLAALGAKVQMLERSPIIAALLSDALTRLKQSSLGAKLHLELTFTQSFDFINNLFYIETARPDVIYLDPMYPERTKSALGKKEMRILHEIVGEDVDADKLLEIALKVAKKRVVVKRPKLAPPLGNRKPDLVYSKGKSSRFDTYLLN